jgi:hypothetical protein
MLRYTQNWNKGNLLQIKNFKNKKNYQHENCVISIILWSILERIVTQIASII